MAEILSPCVVFRFCSRSEERGRKHGRSEDSCRRDRDLAREAVGCRRRRRFARGESDCEHRAAKVRTGDPAVCPTGLRRKGGASVRETQPSKRLSAGGWKWNSSARETNGCLSSLLSSKAKNLAKCVARLDAPLKMRRDSRPL